VILCTWEEEERKESRVETGHLKKPGSSLRGIPGDTDGLAKGDEEKLPCQEYDRTGKRKAKPTGEGGKEKLGGNSPGLIVIGQHGQESSPASEVTRGVLREGGRKNSMPRMSGSNLPNEVTGGNAARRSAEQ